MNRSTSRAALAAASGLTALVAAFTATSPAAAHDDHGTPTSRQLHARNGADLTALKKALAPYRDAAVARAEGFIPVSDCTESPEGGMGIHFLNPARVMGPLDPMKPAVLLYGPTPDGGLRLLGAEYFTVDADQDTRTDGDRPSVWGRPFDGPMEGHDASMPVHYDLHVWVYDSNPAGVFAPWNPSVSC